MSRLTNGESIPQVGIQGYASPIQTNVLPAPGQQLQGNTWQQVAESLSVFNSGLMAFGQAKVTQQNRLASEAGAAVDFSQVFAKGDQLNKSFKQIVAEMNLPDSANPYFLAAAEQNFGSRAAMKVRNGVLSRMAELSNPDLDSSQQANLLNQIIAEESQKWGSQRFNGNFYATNAFNEGVASFFPEIERQANEQYLRNKETQALGDFESAVTEYLTIGKMDDAGSDQFSREIVAKMTGLQRFTTDPEKVRSAIFRSVVTAFQGAETEEEVANIMAAALDLPYGKDKTVADNMGLYAQLAAARERAEDDIERKADQEDRRFRRAAAAAVRSLGETGFDQAMISAIQSGVDTTAAFNAKFDEWRQQNPDLPEAVVDAVYQDKFSLLAQLTQNQRAITRGDDTQSRNLILGKIASGEITSGEQLISVANVFGVDASSLYNVWEAFNDGSRPQLGSRANMLTQTLADTADKSGLPFDAFRENAEIFDEVTQAVAEFIEGGETLNGETYQQIRSTKGRKAAKAALDQFERQRLESIRKRYEIQFQSDLATRDQRLSASAALAEDPSLATTPAEQKAFVESVELKTITGLQPAYDALTYSPTNPQMRRFSSPDALANRASMLLEQSEGAEISFSIVPRTSGMLLDKTNRTVRVQNGLFKVYRTFNTKINSTEPGELIATFTRQQMRQYAVDARMQPFSGIAVEDVLQDRTGVPGVPLNEYLRLQPQQRFPWQSVPVFATREEFDKMMMRQGYTDEQYGQFLNVILNGDLRPETIAAFRDRQALLINNRDIYRNAAR